MIRLTSALIINFCFLAIGVQFSNGQLLNVQISTEVEESDSSLVAVGEQFTLNFNIDSATDRGEGFLFAGGSFGGPLSPGNAEIFHSSSAASLLFSGGHSETLNGSYNLDFNVFPQLGVGTVGFLVTGESSDSRSLVFNWNPAQPTDSNAIVTRIPINQTTELEQLSLNPNFFSVQLEDGETLRGGQSFFVTLSVPEPSSTLLIGFIGSIACLRRRKCM